MIPNDVADLSLAPVLLALDERLEALGSLSRREVAETVALEGDLPDSTTQLRVDGVIRAVTHLIDLHGWTVTWGVRGVEVFHDHHRVVLGVPQVVRDFVNLGSST